MHADIIQENNLTHTVIYSTVSEPSVMKPNLVDQTWAAQMIVQL